MRLDATIKAGATISSTAVAPDATSSDTGATAASLRGLSVQSTLTLFDGLRMAPYPLADDGQRNFVDMNTIPSALVERIEVLKDGASSTYGADAVAGVINVIMKKQVEGLHLNGSAGISDRGDGAEQRLDATWGYGDLATQGYNFYVNGEYQNTAAVNASDRGYPFNSSDLSRICNDAGSCIRQPAGARNFFNADGTFSGLASTTVPLVRPVDATGAETIITDGPFVESKEWIGGFWIIEAPDLDVALELAAEGSKACNRKVEVRPFQ